MLHEHINIFLCFMHFLRSHSKYWKWETCNSTSGLSNNLFIYGFPPVVSALFVQGRTLHGPGDEACQQRRSLQVGRADPRWCHQWNGWNRPHVGSPGLWPRGKPTGLRKARDHVVPVQLFTGESCNHLKTFSSYFLSYWTFYFLRVWNQQRHNTTLRPNI